MAAQRSPGDFHAEREYQALRRIVWGFGVTQTIPEAPRSPTLAEVVRAAIDSRLRETHVALPGRVEKYDAAEQKADIKPMVQDLVPTREGTELVESLPVIPNVPVAFPRGGGYFMTFPLQQGDFVLLVFNERSIDTWASGDGAEKNPDDFRTHNLTDAVAIPGFYPFSQAVGEGGIDANMVLGKDGGSTVHIKDDGEIHLGKEDPTEFIALAQKVLDELNDVKADFVALNAVFDSHIHTTTATVSVGLPGVIAPTTTSAPTPHTPAAVESSKVKAE